MKAITQKIDIMNPVKTTSNAASPFLGVGFCAFFVALGTYLYFIKATQPDAQHADIIRTAGVACITFFGLLLLMALIRAFSRA